MKVPETKKRIILIIDDELQMRRLLRACLERNGYDIAEAGTAEEGLAAAVRHQPDAVLLDLGLPDADGLGVLKRLREWSQAPVLVVSVRDHEDEKITALDNGANDYITKPFSTGELLARLRVAERCVSPPNKLETFETGDLKVSLVNRTVEANGHPVRLSSTEYALLVFFVQHAGKALTHAQILRQVWGPESAANIGQLRVYMAYLREKLEKTPSEPELLLTEPGVGYRLAVR